MPLPRVSLKSFLATAKTAARSVGANSPPSTPVTFVIGNESADLDSLCSAIVLAYLRTYAPDSPHSTFYIPLCNIPFADLSLRPELSPVFQRAKISRNDLITLSDVQLSHPSPIASEQTNWVLVDHNALQGELGSRFGGHVVGCIDHHDEENKVPRDTGLEPRVVKKSGSCSSLVVQYGRAAWDALVKDSKTNNEVASWNADIAHVALAPILIDTTYLKSKDKTTKDDIEAVNYLESIITAIPGNRYDGEAYFQELSKAKESVDDLSLNDILRKDYKQWTENNLNLGISSIVKDVHFLVNKAGGMDNFLQVLKAFAEERKLSICSIMTTSNPNGQFQRELLVWGMDEKGITSAKQFFEKDASKLGLETWSEGKLDSHDDGWRQCWIQKELACSRKQVAPLLRGCMG
ncbi:hypothetical protein BP5796_05182 [Coleophoma crateriformis]|uniref:DHHA2 domain-containing protein n=1 Tax=Coleophoma crateriformis TaxID=565419 RepID=A0A3D8S332_9HELO|nr:hypothetical protein BP5796_05182 [Coleophoma crateriformis]